MGSNLRPWMCSNVFILFRSYLIVWLGIEFLVGRISFRTLKVLLYCLPALSAAVEKLDTILIHTSLYVIWFLFFSFCGSFRFSSLTPVLLNIMMICFVVALRFQLPLSSLNSSHPSSFHNFSCSTSLLPPFFVGLCLSKSCTVIIIGFVETVAAKVCVGFQNFCFVTTYYFITIFSHCFPYKIINSTTVGATPSCSVLILTF